MPTAPPRGRLGDVHADVLGLHSDHTVEQSAQIKETFAGWSSET